MFMVGFAGVLFMTTANTRLQLLVPGHIRGRVMGMYALLFVGTTPIGSLLIGQLAESVGVQATVLCMAGLCAAGVAAGLLYARRSAPVTGGGGRMILCCPATLGSGWRITVTVAVWRRTRDRRKLVGNF